jgi:hypothetical protein
VEVGCSDKLAYVAAVLTAVKSVAVPATDGKKRGETEKQRKLNFFFQKSTYCQFKSFILPFLFLSKIRGAFWGHTL